MLFYIFRMLKRMYVFFRFKELKSESCQTSLVFAYDKACQTDETTDEANATANATTNVNIKSGNFANSINSINLINMRNFEDKNIQTDIRLSDICNENEWSNLTWSKTLLVGSKPNLLDIV
jgi:hypothetical protein